MFYADSLGFLGYRGEALVVEKGLNANLLHITAVPPWVSTTKEALMEIEKFKKMIVGQSRLRLVLNQKDLLSAVADKKIAVVLGMQNTTKDINDCNNLCHLVESGICIISPCYASRNILGSGWLNSDIELSDEGKRFIRNCSINGVIVDISHSGHKMARDIISYVKEGDYSPNLMASHGGCHYKYHHFRNLPDDVLKAVTKLGGVVGITTLTFTNHETNNSVFPFKDHLIHAINLCGEDTVCVGSDDIHVTLDVAERLKRFEIMSKKLDPLKTQGARFPENPLEIAGSDMLEKLHKFCGPYFSTQTLEKIFGINLLRFFERALPAQ